MIYLVCRMFVEPAYTEVSIVLKTLFSRAKCKISRFVCLLFARNCKWVKESREIFNPILYILPPELRISLPAGN